MVHVAVIGLRGIPDVMGGIESHCGHVLPRMVSKAPKGQLKVTVLARNRYAPKKSRVRGVDQISLRAPAHPALETIVHSIRALFYARIVLRADCIHLHGIGPGLVAPLAWLLGMPILFTHHGEDYRRKKWGRVSKLALRLGEVLAVTCARRVITVSHSTCQQLRRRFPRRADRIVHIPNGVPKETADADASVAPAVAEWLNPGRYLISVGRLVPEKAHDVLIAAYRNSGLSRQNSPVKLVIVGAVDHASDYADQLLSEADENVIFAGRLPHGAVMRLNRDAALFILPSYHEGLSIAALEALQAGTPILLSDIEANRGIRLPPHHYFETGSSEALCAKLRQPLSSFVAPADFDVGAFDWDQIGDQTLQQLSLIQRRGLPLVRPSLAESADHA